MRLRQASITAVIALGISALVPAPAAVALVATAVPATAMAVGASSGCPPMSSLCNPTGLAVLGALDASAGLGATTVATTGAATGVSGITTAQLGLNTAAGVTALGYTATELIIGDGTTTSPGATGLPLGPEPGFSPTQTYERVPSEGYPANSTVFLTWSNPSTPEYGAPVETVSFDYAVAWKGEWTRWTELPHLGLIVRCRNGASALFTQPTPYRGAKPGADSSGTLSYTFRSGAKACGGSRGGFSHVEFVPALLTPILGYYYPRGHPLRNDAQPGDGTLERVVTCLDATGQSTTLRQDWVGNISQGGRYQLQALTCPAGSVASSFSANWSPTSSDDARTSVTPETPTPSWVRDLPTAYPECVEPGADCRLFLYRTDTSPESNCGVGAIECPDWYIDPNRAQNYACGFGPYQVDLAYCSVFRDPGNLLPNTDLTNTGTTQDLQWPPLDLDTDVVARAAARVQARYGNDACAVLGEAARVYASRAPVIETVLVCQGADILTAVRFISLADFVGLDGAVRALAEAADAPAPARLDPDCNLIDSTGACADPTQRTVSVGSTTWVTGPKSWDSPSNQTVATVHDTCIEMVKAATPSLSTTQATEKCESQPIFVPGGKIGFGREAAEHDFSVIAHNPDLVELEYISNSNKLLAGVRDQWYRNGTTYLAPCTGQIQKSVTDCDEYPFYSAVEGGPAAYSTYGQNVLRPIDWLDNRSEGRALGMMYRDAECAMTSAVPTSQPPGATGGTNYLVVPVPTIDVPSFYLCPSGD